MSDFRDQGVVWIWVCQHGAYGEEDLADSESGGPLVLQNVQADGAVGVYVWMVDARRKVHLGGLKWVVGGEVDVQEEDAAGVGGVGGAHNCGLPVEQVVADRASAAGSGWVPAEVLQFFGDAL